MIDLNDILRQNEDANMKQNEDANMKEAARSIYILFRSLCEAGFTEDQAMQIVTATIGNIRNGVQK